MNHYPHHIGDFDRATRHLTRLERSIYRDLLDLYYDTERPLSSDLAWLCRKIIANSTEESTAVERMLNEFFTETPTGWANNRCEEEIERYHNNSSQKATAGRASAAARAAKRQQAFNGCSTAVQRNTNADPTNQNQNQNQNQNHTLSDDGAFTDFWTAYPRKVGKPAAMKAFRSAKINGNLSTVLEDIEARKGSEAWLKGGGQYIPHPSTYLNQRRWEDEEPAEQTSMGGFL